MCATCELGENPSFERGARLCSRSSRMKEKRPDPGDFAWGSDRPREVVARALRQAFEQQPQATLYSRLPRGGSGERVGPADAVVARRFKRPTGPTPHLTQIM